MARTIMIQGTCSGAGKSLLAAGLCRIFAQEGVKVAPYKSQNMALNSFITLQGAEIGRAQALQAEAAGVEPTADMNPVLLKATGEAGCQVIVNGSVHSNMTATEYYDFHKEGWEAARAAYDRLSRSYDLIVIEGAGSPAEINLADREIVNMSVARYTNSPVLLVGDIDRGGVFASFYGTLGLLDGDAARIKGFVINKFRGDIEILRPGCEMIEDKTGVPVVGVVPFVRKLGLDEEDGFSELRFKAGAARALRVVVVRLNYISNFTDFEPFRYEPDVELAYSTDPVEMANADLLIVPGSKNTVRDLLYIRENGIEEGIKRAAKKGVAVVGVCGGYQMLGTRITDPLGVESDLGDIKGIGLLDIETELQGEKVTARAEAETSMFGAPVRLSGYEIHMGRTTGDTGLFNLYRFGARGAAADGSIKGNVWGTYLHGLFDSDDFRAAVLDALRRKKGLPVPKERVDYAGVRKMNMQRWADVLEASLDMGFIRGLI